MLRHPAKKQSGSTFIPQSPHRAGKKRLLYARDRYDNGRTTPAVGCTDMCRRLITEVLHAILLQAQEVH